MKIWICIPVFNRIQFTLKCLATLKAQTYQNFTVVICDHGSTDGSSTLISQQFPSTVILTAEESLWWTGAINVCISYALENADAADALLTLNNDTELQPDYLQQLVSYSGKYQDAILTSVIHDIKTGDLVEVGFRQNWLLATSTPVDFATHHIPNDSNVIALSHASGRGTLFPVSVFNKIGLFDEIHLPHYAADYDFTFKAAKAGFKIYACKHCRVFSHIEATGLTSVLSSFSVKSFLEYFKGMRSPANLKTRWWLGWNNCPKLIFPIYMSLDFLRVTASYFKYHIRKSNAL